MKQETLPLSALLSHVLVAFTIEFDNDFERQMPHRTTNHGAGSREGPWLVSLVMWSNCMRFVGERGVTVGDLERLARTPTNLNGMERWGYVSVVPGPGDMRPKPPLSALMIQATANGRKAQGVWQSLFAVIEKRWQERFGAQAVDLLKAALVAVAAQFTVALPDCLPILGYGLFSCGPKHPKPESAPQENLEALTLPALLSRVLLAFAIHFEHKSSVSLSISANLLRVLDDQGIPVRELPRRTGVSKESIRMATGILLKRHLVVIEPDRATPRTKVARLTPEGSDAQQAFRDRLAYVEQQWIARFGEAVGELRGALLRLVNGPHLPSSPLLPGLQPYPDGWRASVPQPETLPHYPMVLHRGGFPDGS